MIKKLSSANLIYKILFQQIIYIIFNNFAQIIVNVKLKEKTNKNLNKIQKKIVLFF